MARVVHFLKKHLTGRKILNTLVPDGGDDIIYGKVGTSAAAFKKAMDGKTILDAGQQGKYFWLVADSPPHPVMHLGMTGWVKFSNDDSGAYKAAKKEETEWPPRFWKFVLQMEPKNGEKCEAAFIDARRLGRIRLVDVAADQLRNTTPLKENGPDPVIDKKIVTTEWLAEKMRSKKVPVKAFLLDQANISGVGNWVADEVLYQARIHPEQYSNTFGDKQVNDLHNALIDVCTTACDLLADSDRFPSHWLMKHRWGKGKKDSNVLPNGEKITHITVGGRTSAVVLSRQKKTGAVPEAAIKAEQEAAQKEDSVADGLADDEETPARKVPKKSQGTKRKSNGVKVEEEPQEDRGIKRSKGSDKTNGVKKEEPKSKTKAAGKANPKATKASKVKEEAPGRRRSARLST